MKNIPIISICGLDESGKTTLAKTIQELVCPEAPIYSFATPLKKICSNIFPLLDFYSKPYSKEVREILVNIGDAINKINPRYFIDIMEEKINESLTPIIIDDLRFHKEYNFLKNTTTNLIVIKIITKDIPINRYLDIYESDFKIINETLTFNRMITPSKKDLEEFVQEMKPFLEKRLGMSFAKNATLFNLESEEVMLYDDSSKESVSSTIAFKFSTNPGSILYITERINSRIILLRKIEETGKFYNTIKLYHPTIIPIYRKTDTVINIENFLEEIINSMNALFNMEYGLNKNES